MEEVNVNEKIREIISYHKLSDRQFCVKIGINPSVLGSMFQKGTEPSAKVKTLHCNQGWYFNNIMNSLVVRSPVWLF